MYTFICRTMDGMLNEIVLSSIFPFVICVPNGHILRHNWNCKSTTV